MTSVFLAEVFQTFSNNPLPTKNNINCRLQEYNQGAHPDLGNLQEDERRQSSPLEVSQDDRLDDLKCQVVAFLSQLPPLGSTDFNNWIHYGLVVENRESSKHVGQPAVN